MSDLVGLCSLCGRPDAMFTCQLCGRLVCDRCFNRHHMVCFECHLRKRQSDSPSFPMD